jgi:asparagine synthase (glutamine-hydrolysing)
MAIFVLSQSTESDELRGLLERRLSPAGFEPLADFLCGSWRLMLFGRAGSPTLSIHRAETPGEFGCAVGTFVYDGLTGEKALERAFATFDESQGVRGECSGHFALLLRRNDRTILATDRLGAVKIYWNESEGILSNSFICTLSGTRAPRLARQEVYEYAWQGSVFGDRTFIEQIRSLPPNHIAVVDRSVRLAPVPTDPEFPPETNRVDLSAVTERQLAALRPIFKRSVRGFPDRLRLALSGGYDSRLVLALLLEAGARPDLYVYGTDVDPDVRVAKDVSRAVGLSIDVVDKSDVPLASVEQFAEFTDRDLIAFDGWKVDGIFDQGSDFPSRVQRVDRGFAVLNGSGGEIYRNFFHLSDRGLRLRDLVWSFYCRFDPKACTREFQAQQYIESLVAKTRATLDTGDDRLDRSMIDRLYPLFRVRYWTGRDAAINQLFGYSWFPFLELPVVRASLQVPTRMKDYGRLQAAMIRCVSPDLASYPSVYGHSFADPEPPLATRLKELKSTLRPARLRRLSYRWRYRRRQPFPPCLAERFLDPIIGSDRPFMSRYFVLDRIHHPDTYNRICTLELLCQRFGVESA